jgi:hypothetical protein
MFIIVRVTARHCNRTSIAGYHIAIKYLLGTIKYYPSATAFQIEVNSSPRSIKQIELHHLLDTIPATLDPRRIVHDTMCDMVDSWQLRPC